VAEVVKAGRQVLQSAVLAAKPYFVLAFVGMHCCCVLGEEVAEKGSFWEVKRRVEVVAGTSRF
jgi:hypothetical protein